ncbi:hypothetical protein FEZ18_03400 [Oceanihabitans sp. IOP_32]|uniref:hypothetical protein n=1 Tax=Oceanihabitans sp. IOP_32 TaxID=2529032 RepID=UPI001293D700|nr:hypothetical protein [Oceanihabitans sp. IOP_32]QFZ53923.1 hypothetical protein FEZ18_03400 [Oceanihabitans sp. IOP_32]
MLQGLKYLLLYLLTFLFGVQTTYSETEFVLSPNQISFSIELTQNFKSLEKELQPNIGFLKEKSKFGKSEGSSVRINCHCTKWISYELVNAGGNLPSLLRQLTTKPTYKPLRTIWSKEGKTTTFIGKWDETVNGQQNGLQKVFDELSESDLNIYMQSGKFEHRGGFNMLSIEDFSLKQAEYVQKINTGQINSSWTFDDYIWEAYNRPWLESALQRGDDIIIWSDPVASRNGFYQRELDFIQTNANQYGYDYNLGISTGTFSK